MMQHYLKTKEENKDCILFYRLGDFYEMFFEDAKIVSKELELTLTGKSCGMEERAPMCGIPYHAVDSYLNRLVKKAWMVKKELDTAPFGKKSDSNTENVYYMIVSDEKEFRSPSRYAEIPDCL